MDLEKALRLELEATREETIIHLQRALSVVDTGVGLLELIDQARSSAKNLSSLQRLFNLSQGETDSTLALESYTAAYALESATSTGRHSTAHTRETNPAVNEPVLGTSNPVPNAESYSETSEEPQLEDNTHQSVPGKTIFDTLSESMKFSDPQPDFSFNDGAFTLDALNID